MSTFPTTVPLKVDGVGKAISVADLRLDVLRRKASEEIRYTDGQQKALELAGKIERTEEHLRYLQQELEPLVRERLDFVAKWVPKYNMDPSTELYFEIWGAYADLARYEVILKAHVNAWRKTSR